MAAELIIAVIAVLWAIASGAIAGHNASKGGFRKLQRGEYQGRISWYLDLGWFGFSAALEGLALLAFAFWFIGFPLLGVVSFVTGEIGPLGALACIGIPAGLAIGLYVARDE